MKHPSSERRNRLQFEKSPYLLQHAQNPVDWYPWGEEAFRKAKEENKVIFLSIGYSTCHWCHVMERESFENEEIAALLNKDFVSIKVDREERPDIDHVYMSAVQLLTQSGGWPLTVFLTPEGKPFTGGTYFPPDDRWGRIGMKALLPRIADLWQSQKDQILDSSTQIIDALKPSNSSSGDIPLLKDLEDKAFIQYCRQYDAVSGGLGHAPKFPSSHHLSYLLSYGYKTKNTEAIQMVEHSLTKMAMGGICDHLGGGFHRYSTDEKWLVPHFEKMLYDQAVLARTYIETFQITGKSFYAEAAQGILNYVLRDMTHPEGGFYSAEDADSEGEEGVFYVWTPEQIESVLGGEDAKLFCAFYQVTTSGNFEHQTSILNCSHTVDEFAREYGFVDTEFKVRLNSMKSKLLAARKLRIPPLKDDKVLTSWNGLMISAFALAGFAMNEPKYLNAAERSANFILSKHQINGRLMRRFRDGEVIQEAFHEDYAAMIAAFLDLYETTFDPKWLVHSRQFALKMVELFYDAESGGFFYASKNGEALVASTKDYYDGAIPSSNSVSVVSLARLSKYFENDPFKEIARKTILSNAHKLATHPAVFPWMLLGLQHLQNSAEFIYCSGDHAKVGTELPIFNRLRKFYEPGKILIGFRNRAHYDEMKSLIPWLPDFDFSSSKETLLICKDQSCRLPIDSLEALNDFIKLNK